jgi:hypothetical protein
MIVDEQIDGWYLKEIKIPVQMINTLSIILLTIQIRSFLENAVLKRIWGASPVVGVYSDTDWISNHSL